MKKWLSLGLVLFCAGAPLAANPPAEEILTSTGTTGGLVVHVGCGDGVLTAALRAGDGYLVHGLDADPENVEKARGHIRSLALYGNVSADKFDGRRLPYVDNLVNLIVVSDLGEVSNDEVMRVLCPGGVATIRQDGKWTSTVKPRPAEIGQWSHFLCDATNNAIAQDTVVGPPRRMKWKCGPEWSRSHEFSCSIAAMVSTAWPGWYHAHRGARSGQLLVVGPQRTYALQAFPTRNRQSPLFTPGEKGYLLLADANDTEPILDDLTRGATKGMGYTRLKPPVWFDWAPIRVRGMVLASDNLFVAGPPDVVDPEDPMASFEGRKGGVLRTYAAADGKMLAERKLDAPPVFDGLIAANGRLFMCTTDGRVVCLAGQGADAR